MTVLGPDVLSVSTGHRYPLILQAVFAQGQNTVLNMQAQPLWSSPSLLPQAE